MTRIWIRCLALMLFALPLQVQGAEQVKLKYTQTLYADAGGVALRHPEGVTCTDDKLFVVDSGNKRIVRYSYKNGVVTPETTFSLPKMYPLMVQVSNQGDLYVLDGKDRKISILSPDGGPKGSLDAKGVPGVQKIVPRSFQIARDGSIALLDIFSERVLMLDDSGKFLRQIPFPEDVGFCSDLAVDRHGTVYLLDSVKAVVYKAGKGEEKFTALTLGMKDNMNFPTSLATDNRGNIYLVDQYGSGLAIIGLDGSFLGRKLGMGWSDSHLYYPTEISISEAGEIFIADRGNNRVQQFVVAE